MAGDEKSFFMSPPQLGQWDMGASENRWMTS
jgi:hypothetical protein